MDSETPVVPLPSASRGSHMSASAGARRRPRAFLPLTALLLASASFHGCGETFEWDPDGSGEGTDGGADTGGSPGGPKRVLGPATGRLVFGSPAAILSDEGVEKAPRLGLAAVGTPWIVGGSGKSSYLKIHLECLDGLDAEESGCLLGTDGAHAFSSLRVAVADDEGGLLASGQAHSGAKVLISEAEDDKSVRTSGSFTVLSKGEEKVARGGILVVLPLGGEPVQGWSRVLLLERVHPETRETTFAWIPFRYELDR